MNVSGRVSHSQRFGRQLTLCSQCIDETLKGEEYQESKVDVWVNTICENILKGLTELQKPFKYTGELVG